MRDARQDLVGPPASWTVRAFLPVLAGIFTTAAASGAGIFQETGGVVAIEAEHFDSRAAATDGHTWHVAPTEDGADGMVGAPAMSHARNGAYIQSLPDSPGGGAN